MVKKIWSNRRYRVLTVQFPLSGEVVIFRFVFFSYSNWFRSNSLNAFIYIDAYNIGGRWWKLQMTSVNCESNMQFFNCTNRFNPTIRPFRLWYWPCDFEPRTKDSTVVVGARRRDVICFILTRDIIVRSNNFHFHSQLHLTSILNLTNDFPYGFP